MENKEFMKELEDILTISEQENLFNRVLTQKAVDEINKATGYEREKEYINAITHYGIANDFLDQITKLVGQYNRDHYKRIVINSLERCNGYINVVEKKQYLSHKMQQISVC